MNNLKGMLFLGSLLVGSILVSGCAYIEKLKARDQLNRGVNSYSGQKYEEAVEYFQTAIRLDPELSVAYLYLATTYRAQFQPGSQSMANLQQAQKAIATFQTVLDMDPSVADPGLAANAMANIATIYNGLGDYEKAKEWQLNRVDIEPDNPEPLYGIGTIDWQLAYDKTGMIGENVEFLTEEEAAQVQKDVEEGIQVLKQALDIRPDYHDAMQYLNLLYREKAKLTSDEEEKKKWQREADNLALKALQVKRRQEAEEERARRSFSGGPES